MRTCIVCACTDEMACDDGCSWVKLIGKSKGLCSACPAPANTQKLTKELRTRRKVMAGLVSRLDGTPRLQLRYFRQAQQSYEQAVEQLRDFERAAGAR